MGAYVDGYEYDIFISYAEVDESDRGWVTDFVANLTKVLEARLGGPGSFGIYFDPGSHYVNSQHPGDDWLLNQVIGRSAIFLAITSTSYAVRAYPKRELALFMQTNPDLERLFAIEYLPLDYGEAHAPPLDRHVRVSFWRPHPVSLVPRPLKAADEVYRERLQDLGAAVCARLKTLKKLEASRRPIAVPPTITESPRATPAQERGKIFISYRRDDEASFAHRLFDELSKPFPGERIFIDVDSIEPGLDFVEVLEDRVSRSDVVLVVIGPSWLSGLAPDGTRRLDNPNDFVRIEVESALKLGKRVIPILVGNTPMPPAAELPESLRILARRNAVKISHDRFRIEAPILVSAVERFFAQLGR